jgi:hypothetical protein
MYLGMTLDFTTAGVVSISMVHYIKDVIKEWEYVTSMLEDGFERVIRRQKIATPAPDDYSRSMTTR